MTIHLQLGFTWVKSSHSQQNNVRQDELHCFSATSAIQWMIAVMMMGEHDLLNTSQ